MLIVRTEVSRSRLHKAIIALGFLMLFWPAATTNLFGDGLAGYEPSSPAPRASLTDWFDGVFQRAADQWWKERFGMRFFFVKLDNQIDFWLFDRVYQGGAGLVFGKDGWLYEPGYIEGYCELREPTPEAIVLELFEGVRALQDAMDARGVPFVLMVSPSKAAVYPEYIPERYCKPHDGAGYDYDVYRHLLDDFGIRYTDGYTLTQAAKPLWPQVTLFTKGGTHWNNLGAYYTADALLGAIRPLTTKSIPPLVLGEVTIDNDLNEFDMDLVAFLNLLFPDTDFPTAHPRITMEMPDDGGVRIVLVGMSFLEQIALIYAESGGFAQVDHYWYYHHDIRDALTGKKTPTNRESIDWEGEILQADAVVLSINMVYFQAEHASRFIEDGLAHLGKAAGN